MVLTRSISSYAPFEADLEGSIIHQTSAVDYYLEKSAQQWNPIPLQPVTTAAQLEPFFKADLSQDFWSAFVSGHGRLSYAKDSLYKTTLEAPIALCRSKRKLRTTPLQMSCAARVDQFLEQDLRSFLEDAAEGPYEEEMPSQPAAYSPAAAAAFSLFTQQAQLPPQALGGAEELYGQLLRFDSSDEGGWEAAAMAPASPEAARAAAAAAVALLVDRPSSTAAVAASTAAAAAAAAAAGNSVPLVPAQQQRQWLGPLGSSSSSISAGLAQEPQQLAQKSAATANGPSVGVQAAAAAAGSEAAAPPPSAPPPFIMEDDEDIAQQMTAALKKLALLEAEAAAAAGGSNQKLQQQQQQQEAGGSSDPPSSNKAKGLPTNEDVQQASCSSSSSKVLEPSRVPARPKPWAVGSATHSSSMHEKAQGEGKKFREADFLRGVEQSGFFNTMLYTFMACMVLLPILLAQESLMPEGGGGLKAQLLQKLQRYYSYVLLPLVPVLLLYPGNPIWRLRANVLHFEDMAMEHKFISWFSRGKLHLDGLFHVLWLLMGGSIWARVHYESGAPLAPGPSLALAATMLGPLAPTGLLLLLWPRGYRARREVLLVGSRLAFTAALLYLHQTAGEQLQQSMSVQFGVLAQLTSAVCLQTRLSRFMPIQALHLLVLLWTLGPVRLLMHLVQLLGFGLCLPCLLLYSLEVYARRGYLAMAQSNAGALPLGSFSWMWGWQGSPTNSGKAV